MAFEPVDKLTNRTFVGLIVAQFLAGFNDQFIHAAGMFYAMHTGILTEAQAISLMPILFYAPWAIFCTLSGYFADRYSKTYALRIWKVSEIVIALFMLAGFFVPFPVGPWMVLSCVFLIGTHAAFFAPAKYGAMPEILQPHVLSRGNGILESTTFLAAILGSVAGGLLFFIVGTQKFWIAIFMLVLAIIGALASLMIAYLPAANPERRFPTNLVKPLIENLGTLFRSKALRLAVLGIAFFIFMVAYMRQCMYMHGETRMPRWDEFKTSLIVATVALGVGLGSPLAGYLSGGKIELGLVPIGCIGMIIATMFAALTIHMTWALVLGMIIIGFFSGFYMVPLYTLLQHRAPKTSKGDLVATSNFINVIGAMAASVLFFVLVQIGQATGVTPVVEQTDNFAEGELLSPIDYRRGRPTRVEIKLTTPIQTEDGKTIRTLGFGPKPKNKPLDPGDVDAFREGLLEMSTSSLATGDPLIVSSYVLHGRQHYFVRLASEPLPMVHDNDGLPSYLFLGAALMTMSILALLTRQLPDFFVRSIFWLRALRGYRLKAVGMQLLPNNGAVILATNCHRLEANLQLVSVTDRFTTFVMPEAGAKKEAPATLRMLLSSSLLELPPGTSQERFNQAEQRALDVLKQGNLLAVPVDEAGLEAWLSDIRQRTQAPVVPVFVGPLEPANEDKQPVHIRVVFGDIQPEDATLEQIRQAIVELGESVRSDDGAAKNVVTAHP